MYEILITTILLTLLRLTVAEISQCDQNDAALQAEQHNQTSNATYWGPCNYPNPQSNWEKCGRSEASWICDPDGLLTTEQADRLDDMLSQSSFCRCYGVCSPIYHAHPIVILLTEHIRIVDGSVSHCIDSCGDLHPELDTSSQQPQTSELRTSMESFSSQILERWSLGRCEDEVVILYMSQYQRLTVSAGQLAHEKLGDIYESSQTKALIQLSNNGLQSALEILVNEYTSVLYHKNNSALILGIVVSVIVGAIILFGLVMTVLFCHREFQQGKSCRQVFYSCVGGEYAIVLGGNKRSMVPTSYESRNQPAEMEPAISDQNI